MPVQNELVEVLKELEGDLKHFGVRSGAIVYPGSANSPDCVRRVFEKVSELGVVNYSQNFMESMFVEGTDIRLERIKMTGMTMIDTSAGKLVIPPGVKFYMSSRR